MSCNEKNKEINPQSNILKYYVIDIHSKNANIKYSKILNKKFSDSIYYQLVQSKYTKNEYKFPIQKEAKTIKINEIFTGKLIDKKEYQTDSEINIVYKYYYKSRANDGDELIFFNPNYGILITKSISWGNYEMLIGSEKKSDTAKIFYLNQKIISDCNFFNYE